MTQDAPNACKGNCWRTGVENPEDGDNQGDFQNVEKTGQETKFRAQLDPHACGADGIHRQGLICTFYLGLSTTRSVPGENRAVTTREKEIEPTR